MARRIQTISHVGASDQGMAIVFQVQYADGGGEEFSMPHELLAMALQGLQTAGQLAQQMRAKLPPQEYDVSYTNRVTSVGRRIRHQYGLQLRFAPLNRGTKDEP